MAKKALLIGSEGNIGKPLGKYLLDIGYNIAYADIKQGWKKNYFVVDINHPIDLVPVFTDFKPDVVFLLSAMVSRVTCEQAAGLAVSTNLCGVQNVLELCKRFNTMTVFFSTSEVYGPKIELMDDNIKDPNPNNRYGLTKLLGEKLVEYEVKNYGLRAVTLRPFMMYDEYEELGDHRSAMIRFASNLAENKSIEVHKGSYRSWLHVSDAVKAIEAAAHVSKYEVINIGHPDVRPIEELAERIKAKLNAPDNLIHYINLPNKMTLKKSPMLNKQENLLGIKPKVSFEEGIERVVSAIKSRLKK